MKKMLIIVKVCLIGLLSTYATAANWDNGEPGSDSWTDAANWQGDVLPAGANTWMDNSDTAVIYAGDTGNVGMFFPQGSGGGTADLTIHGTLNTTGRIRIGDAINTIGIITIDGGTLNVPDHMYVGSAYLAGNISASGTLVVKNGGVVNQTANGYGLKVPAHYADANTSGVIELYDGTINTVDLYIGATGLVKVGTGSIIIEGNEFTEVNNYVAGGLLVPMNPSTMSLNVSYDGTNTIITTIPMLHGSPYTDKWGTAALWHFDELISGAPNKMVADDDSILIDRDRDLTFCEGLNITTGGAVLVDPAILGALDFPSGNSDFGKCLQFDGLNDLLRYDGNRDFLQFNPDNVKIEAWVRLDDNFEEFGSGAEYYIFSSYNQMNLRINDSADGLKLNYQVTGDPNGNYWNSSKLYSDMEVNPYEWHHVALTSHENALTVAVNGTVVASQTLTEGVSLNPASPGHYVGARNNYGSNSFWGYLDEVRVSEAVETEPGCGYWGYQSTDFNQDCQVDLLDAALLNSEWMKDTTLSGADNPQERIVTQTGNYNVPLATVTPSINGAVAAGEWDDAKLIQMVYPSFATLPNVGTSHIDPTEDADDFSLFWYAKWDSENLYLMGIVKDDIYNAAAGQDEPQLCFNYQKAGTTYLVDASVWNLPVGGVINTNTGNPLAFAPDETDLAGSVTADGYVVELALAWNDFDPNSESPLYEYVPAAGDEHGFGLACQDHDAEGEREHFYADFGTGALNMGNLSSWNTITLVNALTAGENGYCKTDVSLNAAVDTADLEIIAEQWLSCTDPEGAGCINAEF